MSTSFSKSLAAFAAAVVASIVAVTCAQARPEGVSVELGYAPGTIVIVNSERKIYYVTGAGRAIRYGVAVGKASELWTGRTYVSDKKVDPRWIPVDGSDPVEGGDPSNPLGKRAMYLDWSLLRIHGTPSRGSIGSAVSNGCVRMLNEDVLDLFERVHIGAPVIAINSRREAGAFKTARVAELVYVDPAARLDAKADEVDAATERKLREQANYRSQLGATIPYPASGPRQQPNAPRQATNPPAYYAPAVRSGYSVGRSPFDTGR